MIELLRIKIFFSIHIRKKIVLSKHLGELYFWIVKIYSSWLPQLVQTDITFLRFISWKTKSIITIFLQYDNMTISTLELHKLVLLYLTDNVKFRRDANVN